MDVLTLRLRESSNEVEEEGIPGRTPIFYNQINHSK